MDELPSETSPHRFEPESSTAPSGASKPKLPTKRVRKPPQVPKSEGESGRKKSEVWGHFDQRPAEGKNCRMAICKYCGREYMADPQIHGTSNLWAHITNCTPYKATIEVKGQQTLGFKPSPDGQCSELVPVTFTVEAARKALAEMVVIDEFSFRFVEGVGFKRFMHVVQPKFTPIPSRQTIARDIQLIYDKERTKLMKMMKGRRICLTTDCWTSIQNMGYMCLTAHFIDDKWNLHKRILNFCTVEDHKGETIGAKIESCLLEWNIDSFLTLTVDNASSNDGAIKFLQRTTKTWKGTVLGHEFLHMRCCAHILNLIVGDGLKQMDQSISNIRLAVRYVRSSPNRFESFKKCAKMLKIESNKLLCLDVSTRWNSTYAMLEAAEKFEKVFERMNEDDYGYRNHFLDLYLNLSDKEKDKGVVIETPKAGDWVNVRVFIKFLRIFYLATKRFSGSLFVTSNTFYREIFIIDSMIRDNIRSKDPLMEAMSRNMKLKFDKYWGMGDKINLLLYVAVVLDPRRKLSYLEFCFAQSLEGDSVKAQQMVEKVTNCLTRLYNHYASLDATNVEVPTTSVSQTVDNMVIDDDDDDDYSKYDSQFTSYLEVKSSISSQSEMDKYFADMEPLPLDNKKADDFDILYWWKSHSTKYRVLSHIARDVLAMPISTVASESAFSTGGRILDPFRSSLHPKMVQMLVCTQNWLRSNMPIDLRTKMDRVEEFEFDQSQSEGGGSLASTSSTCSSPTIIDADA